MSMIIFGSTAFGFILGTILGSFAKAIADRSLKQRSFLGRSYCPSCKHNLGVYDLFPLFSFILLKGKCRYCHTKLSIEYLLVELLMGVLVGFLFWNAFNNFQFPVSSFQFQNVQLIYDLIFKTFFITILIIVAITDLKKTLIPDRVIVPGIWIALVSSIIFITYKIGYLYWYLNQSTIGKLLLPPHNDYFYRHAFYATEPLLQSILVGLGIGGFFMALIIVTKGKGMGGGDVKLGAFMGLGLGFPGGLLATLLAFIIGAVSALTLIVFKKKKFGENIPFGPFLVAGSLIALFWGNRIMEWYLKFSR